VAAPRRKRIADTPVEWYRTVVDSWLAQADRSPDELVDLLEGAGLPPVGHDEEPYLWLLRVLPEDEPERSAAAAKLAATAAVLLEGHPDIKPTTRQPESLLYNLLLLCAGLHRPQELAEPLFDMWKRKALAGRWQGLDLRAALSAALASNQIDERLWPEWRDLLRGKPGRFLPGHPYDGFDGALWMPSGSDQLDKPNLPALGKALKLMASHLETDRQRRQMFQKLIERVLDAYPVHSSWEVDVIRLADRESFPVWAVECLPSLFVELENSDAGRRVALAWHYLVACLGKPGTAWVRRGSLCEGHVLEVEIEEALFQWLELIAPEFEARRLALHFPSQRALSGAALDGMAAVEASEASLGRVAEAKRLRSAREKLLRAQGLLPDHPDINMLAKAVKKTSDSLENDANREELLAGRISLLQPLLPHNPDLTRRIEKAAGPALSEWVSDQLTKSDLWVK
jgi:hypothetical protein